MNSDWEAKSTCQKLSRSAIRLKWVLSASLAIQLLTVSALAEDKLQVDLRPLGSRVRNEAPIPVVVKFSWNSTRILEGRLEMEFHEGNRILGRYHSSELALTGGEQRFRMLLPPALAPVSESQVEVQMKFVTVAGAIEINPSGLFLPATDERALVLGWCDSAVFASSANSEAMQKLLFEHYAPATENRSAKLLTSVARLTPEELPAHPLAYTPFDVLVLTAQAFKETGERQLQALVKWVRGGGSVCVCVSGRLQPYHVSFLNQLNDSLGGTEMFQTDEAGNLVAKKGGVLYLRSGLGRSIIVAGENLVDLGLNQFEIRSTAAFLWKMRSRQARTVEASGHWEPPAISSAADDAYYNQGYPQRRARVSSIYNTLSPNTAESTSIGAELLNRLMPQTVRLIPFSALIGILVLFVLLIGPADYFLLGAIRRRRFTWLLFPLTSIVFTVATMLMANHFLGLRDQRRSLYIVDLAKDGSALRWNQYELIFTGRDKQSVTEVKDALWTPLQAGAMLGQPYGRMYQGQQVLYSPYNSYPNNSGFVLEREMELPLYSGTLPAHFKTSENLRQWKPQLNRTFSFAPPPVPLILNWTEVEKLWPNISRIRGKLSEKNTFFCDVCVLGNQRLVADAPASGGIIAADILRELCGGNGNGFKSVVAQTSPAGGSNLEDTQVLDPDANDAALLIVTKVGDNIIIYRRTFYGS